MEKECVLEVLCFLKKYKSAVQKMSKYVITIQEEMWIYKLNCVIQIFIKKSVINKGIQLHNKVPKNIKKLEEYKSYKRELKSFLIEHAFCSLEE